MVFLCRGRPSTKTADKQASGLHTNTLGREIKSPVQITDFELMTYTYMYLKNYDVPCEGHLKL